MSDISKDPSEEAYEEFIDDMQEFFPHVRIIDLYDDLEEEYPELAGMQDAADEYHALRRAAASSRAEAKALLADLKDKEKRYSKTKTEDGKTHYTKD